MRKFWITLTLICMGFVMLIAFGTLPERRYADGLSCYYRLIYADDGPIGVAAVGGSQMRDAVHVLDFDQLLDARGIDHDPTYSIARKNYHFAAEHLLMRDLITQRPVKTALIMIEPFRLDTEVTETTLKIALLSDLPLVWRSLAGTDFTNRVEVMRQIVVNHLKPTNGGRPPNVFAKPRRHCRLSPDQRLDPEEMLDAQQTGRDLSGQTFDWNLQAPLQDGLVQNVRAFRDFAEGYGTKVIYLLMTGTDDPIAPPDLAERFYVETGAPLITFDPELHAWLAENGRRDPVHVNAAGREILMPWLINQIEEVCERPEGCF